MEWPSRRRFVVPEANSTERFRCLGNHEKPARCEKPDGLAVYHGKGSAPAYWQFDGQWAMGNGQWKHRLVAISDEPNDFLSPLAIADCLLPIPRSLERELQQPLHQLRQGDPGGFPQAWIHADRGESRHRVHLIEQYLTG